jgi:hypothetical protein
MASLPLQQAIVAASQAYSKPDGIVFEYGTAGVSGQMRFGLVINKSV